jgi:hypothetical protein
VSDRPANVSRALLMTVPNSLSEGFYILICNKVCTLQSRKANSYSDLRPDSALPLQSRQSSTITGDVSGTANVAEYSQTQLRCG